MGVLNEQQFTEVQVQSAYYNSMQVHTMVQVQTVVQMCTIVVHTRVVHHVHDLFK